MTGPLTGLSKVRGWFLSMEKLLGPDLEEGLARLRDVAEAAAG
ncbi:MAG: hypothetical protein ACNA8R_09905 [Nitriliruptoraceae bacterium]